MKGRKILLLVGVLVILAAAATLFENSRRRSTTESGALLFPGLKVDQVDRLEIDEEGGKQIVLEKKGEKWAVASENGFPAEPKLVQDILDRLPKFYADQVVSTNPQKQSLFHVDSSGVEVRVFQAGKKTAEFIVGKPGPDFLSTYVRAAGSDRVIQVPEYLPSLFSGHTTWREKTLFSLKPEDMRSYSYASPSRGQLMMKRDEAGAWTMEQPQSGKIDDSRVGMIVGAFGRLKAADFADTMSAEGAGILPDTTWIEVALADGSIHRLEIGAAAPKSRRYVRRKGSEAIVTVPIGSINTMMPPASMLLATPGPS